MGKPAYLPLIYTDVESVKGILSQAGLDTRLDDDDSGYVSNEAEGDLATGGEMVQVRDCMNFATGRINSVAVAKYDEVNLQQSWVVWNWATVIATVCVCRRRNHDVAGFLKEEYDRTMKELEELRAGTLTLADVPLRDAPTMAVDNFRIGTGFHTRQQRMQESISDSRPTRAKLYSDYMSRFPERY